MANLQVDLCGTNLGLTETLSQHVEKSLTQALDRYESRIASIRCVLSNETNKTNHRHLTSQCQIVADVMSGHHRHTVVVAESGDDLYAAVDRATGRLKRAVRRKINRPRDARRSRKRFATPYISA